MTVSAYIDTSALIKRFITEPGTAQVEAFVATAKHRLTLSSLSITEFRSVMKRRLRLGTADSVFVRKANEQLSIEIASGALGFLAIDAALFNLAGDLIEQLDSPLAALDAMHLACAKTAGCSMMVSADKQLLRAAQEAGLEVFDLS